MFVGLASLISLSPRLLPIVNVPARTNAIPSAVDWGGFVWSSTRKNITELEIGTLTMMVPLEFTVSAYNPTKLVCQGPDKADSHSTVAALPGARFEQVSIPFWLNDVIT